MERASVHEDEVLKQEIYSMLTRAYVWLFRSAKPGGHWIEVRSTSLAGLCLVHVLPMNSRWISGVQTWLSRRKTNMAEDKACWGEELWDTSMALIALLRLGAPASDEVVQAALKWELELYDCNGHRNWHDEPWETSWTILALLEAALPRVIPPEAYQAARWLIGLQDKSGRIVAPHYTAYFIQIYAKFKKRGKLEHETEFSRAKSQAVKYLMANLDPDRLWTGEAWSNGQILWSLLADPDIELETNKARTIADWFLRQQLEEGSWAHDAEDTASGVLGLYELIRRLESKTVRNNTELDQLLYGTLRKNIEVPAFVAGRWQWEREEDGTIRVAVHVHPRDQKIAGAVVLTVSTVSLVITFWEQLEGLFRALLGALG